MEELLKQPAKRVVGTKQVLRVLKDGKAAAVFLGKDAEPFLYHQVQSASEAAGVPVRQVDSMQELGKLCLVGVKTAAAAVLK